MDTKQIEYILKIAETKNITHAANQLFITQSALNQQLLNLEKDLGAPLFIRSRSDWHPTEIGEIYLNAAQEILSIKKQTYAEIGDLIEAKKGTLSVSFTPGRGIEMFTQIYPSFHKQYPNIRIIPHELSVKQQQHGIRNGNIDLAFETLTEDQRSNDNYIVLSQEKIFVIVPENFPVSHAKLLDNEIFPTIHLTDLQSESFVLIYKESTLRKPIDKLFEHAGFKPNILFETRSHKAILSMVEAGECCGFIPYYYIKNQIPRGVKVYSLPEPLSWDITVSYKKKSYLSKASRAFISLAKEYYNQL